jgi:hypothetical protein
MVTSKAFSAKDLTKAVTARVSAVVRKTAADVQADAVTAIQTGPKSGRTYKIGDVTRAGGSRNTKKLGGLGLKRVGDAADGRFIVGSRIHRASASGEAPANLYGNLAGSIRAKAKGPLASAIEVGAEYGLALERGSADGKRGPRPFLGPAMDRQEGEFLSKVGAAVAKGIAEGAAASG